MSTSFKIAILFDIHGNYQALKAVVENATAMNPDKFIFGGDVISGLAQPKECLEEYRKINAQGVIGNTDEKVLNMSCEVSAWTNRQLNDEDLKLISSWPVTIRISPPGSKNLEDDLLVAHSTPKSNNDFLVLNPRKPGPTRSGTKTSDDEIVKMLNGEAFNTMLFGHIHYTSERIFEGKKLMSIVPVGLPEDGDQRAGYALAEWEGNNWKITVHRVEYDVESAAQFIESTSQPQRLRYASMIREASYIRR